MEHNFSPQKNASLEEEAVKKKETTAIDSAGNYI